MHIFVSEWGDRIAAEIERMGKRIDRHEAWHQTQADARVTSAPGLRVALAMMIFASMSSLAAVVGVVIALTRK